MSALFTTVPRVLDEVALRIDPDEVLRFQGYQRGRDIPTPDVQALFAEALEMGRRLMAPRAVLRWTAAQGEGADGLVVDGARFTIPGLTETWGSVVCAGLAVCTIGEAVEGQVAELWEARELPLAMMLDSVGSGAVESLAEYVNDVLCQEGLTHGLRVTNRMSPGYGRWDVSDQRVLFGVCPGDLVGVRLNQACFMTPTKSISFVAGAGPDARVDHYFSQCARCWMRDCQYRRTPARTTVRADTTSPRRGG